MSVHGERDAATVLTAMRAQVDYSIGVPTNWCGRTQELRSGKKVWTCGACSCPHVCYIGRACRRAQ